MPSDLEPLRASLAPVFVAEVEDALDSIQASLEQLEAGQSLVEVGEAICASLYAVEGSSATLGFEDVAGYLARVRGEVSRCSRANAEPAAGPDIAALLTSVREMLCEWSASLRESRPFDRARFENLPDPAPRVRRAAASPPPAPPDERSAATTAQSRAGALALSGETVRDVLHHVVQLEVARTRLQHRVGRLAVDPDLEALEHHARALRDLLRNVDPDVPSPFVEAQIVRIAAQRFALPLASIVEGQRTRRARVIPLAGGRKGFDYHGRTIPVVQLAQLADGVDEIDGEFLLVIDSLRTGVDTPHGASQPIALLVDAIEDPEIVSWDGAGVAPEGGIVQQEVSLASGAPAGVLDVAKLRDAVMEQRTVSTPVEPQEAIAGADPAANPAANPTPKPTPNPTRGAAARTWRTLARKTFKSSPGGSHDRVQ